MKNRHLLLCFLLSASMIATADEVTLQSDDKGFGYKGNRTEIPTPHVQYDNDNVEITCDSLINNVKVTITDCYGTVMHSSSEVLSPSSTILFITDIPDRHKFYIEIETDEKVFHGYF